MVTSAGKSTTIPLITATQAKPLPKISVMIGASATRGTVRTSITTGMDAASTPLDSTIPVARIVAAVRPATKPMPASSRVCHSGPRTPERFSAASASREQVVHDVLRPADDQLADVAEVGAAGPRARR